MSMWRHPTESINTGNTQNDVRKLIISSHDASINHSDKRADGQIPEVVVGGDVFPTSTCVYSIFGVMYWIPTQSPFKPVPSALPTWTYSTTTQWHSHMANEQMETGGVCTVYTHIQGVYTKNNNESNDVSKKCPPMRIISWSSLHDWRKTLVPLPVPF